MFRAEDVLFRVVVVYMPRTVHVNTRSSQLSGSRKNLRVLYDTMGRMPIPPEAPCLFEPLRPVENPSLHANNSFSNRGSACKLDPKAIRSSSDEGFRVIQAPK